MRYYAVKIGRVPGIYTNWQEAKEQVHEFPAQYKSFTTLQQAKDWLGVTLSPLISYTPQREFWVHSVRAERVAWAILSDREPPYTQLYNGPPPEQQDRAVLCAILRLLTREARDPELRGPIVVHLYDPNWDIHQAITKWIKIWCRKGWRNGKIINCDLYQAMYPLLKNSRITFAYYNPKHGEPPRLSEIIELCKICIECRITK